MNHHRPVCLLRLPLRHSATLPLRRAEPSRADPSQSQSPSPGVGYRNNVEGYGKVFLGEQRTDDSTYYTFVRAAPGTVGAAARHSRGCTRLIYLRVDTKAQDGSLLPLRLPYLQLRAPRPTPRSRSSRPGSLCSRVTAVGSMSYGRIVFLLRWGLDLRNGIRCHKTEGVFYRDHRVPIPSIPSIPSTVKWQSFCSCNGSSISLRVFPSTQRIACS